MVTGRIEPCISPEGRLGGETPRKLQLKLQAGWSAVADQKNYHLEVFGLLLVIFHIPDGLVNCMEYERITSDNN